MPRLIDRDARKEELAQALWTVIVQRGVGAVSVRSVAAQAGVAVGSLRHVFPTRAELIVFSAELMLHRAEQRITAIPALADPVDHALRIARELLPLTPDTRAELQVNLALFAEAPAVPALTAVRDRTQGALTALYMRLVTLVAPDLPPEAAQPAADRLGALTDGLAMRLLASPDFPPADALSLLREELTRTANAKAT
ncbi:MAG: TetR family transcriptional regulator C-terminal domain-containing protein [Bifidobacteriaceae bacterium]|nr:TetR family transcriptional regulator C-terminal domain-containing protein [Bifidobacteriaceae bacterium]